MTRQQFEDYARAFGATEFDENISHKPTAQFHYSGNAMSFLKGMPIGEVSLGNTGAGFVATLEDETSW